MEDLKFAIAEMFYPGQVEESVDRSFRAIRPHLELHALRQQLAERLSFEEEVERRLTDMLRSNKMGLQSMLEELKSQTELMDTAHQLSSHLSGELSRFAESQGRSTPWVCRIIPEKLAHTFAHQ